MDVSDNQLESLDTFRHLICLQELNADNNCISSVSFTQPMNCLQILSLNGNAGLSSLDLSCLNGLRYLSANECSLSSLANPESAFRLEHLSVQYQRVPTSFSLNTLVNLRELYYGGILAIGYVQEILASTFPSPTRIWPASLSHTVNYPASRYHAPA